MKLIQNEEAKKKVLAEFQRLRFHDKESERKRIIKTTLGEAIVGTHIAISFVGPIMRFYDNVLVHEEY